MSFISCHLCVCDQLKCVCVCESSLYWECQFRLAEQQLSITFFLHYSSISSLDLLLLHKQFSCVFWFVLFFFCAVFVSHASRQLNSVVCWRSEPG